MSALAYSPLAQRLRETYANLVSPTITGLAPLPAGGHDISSPGRIIDLPRIPDARGNLTFIEETRHVPFDVKRVFYLYDVPGGADRGGHAHRNLHQFVIAIAGSFDVILDNGSRAERFSLNRAYYGLHIPPMTWGELENFSSGGVCLVLASEFYDEADYFRDYTLFMDTIGKQA